jgi:hypothetical protein
VVLCSDDRKHEAKCKLLTNVRSLVPDSDHLSASGDNLVNTNLKGRRKVELMVRLQTKFWPITQTRVCSSSFTHLLQALSTEGRLRIERYTLRFNVIL